MHIRIGGIELTKPILKRLTRVDGGVIVWCDAIKDKHDETHLQKLMSYQGSTQHVKWRDSKGMEREGTMSILSSNQTEREGPDAKIITEYVYTLIFI